MARKSDLVDARNALSAAGRSNVATAMPSRTATPMSPEVCRSPRGASTLRARSLAWAEVAPPAAALRDEIYRSIDRHDSAAFGNPQPSRRTPKTAARHSEPLVRVRGDRHRFERPPACVVSNDRLACDRLAGSRSGTEGLGHERDLGGDRTTLFTESPRCRGPRRWDRPREGASGRVAVSSRAELRAPSPCRSGRHFASSRSSSGTAADRGPIAPSIASLSRGFENWRATG